MTQQPYAPQPKDPDTAFLIELVGGFFGLLGLGYIYAGRTEDGIIRLIIWFIVIGGGWLLAVILTTVLIGCLLMPLLLAAQVGVPIWSASQLKKSMTPQDRPAV
jgi:membrane protein insertase Oxa1/YidC/SpoIIIJ